MRILSIGDVHGSLDWQQIVHMNYDADRVVFLGDYVDHWTYSNIQIFDNLIDIIEYKKKNSDKVVLLLGNHCLQYWFRYNTHGCSGFRPEMYHDLHELYNNNRDLFQVAYQYKDHIWAHAGISTGWAKEFGKEISADVLNEEFNTGGLYSKLYDVGKIRGGWSQYGGPLWADFNETNLYCIDGLHQIVGHTKQQGILNLKYNNRSITFTDVLENKQLEIQNKYYLLEL